MQISWDVSDGDSSNHTEHREIYEIRQGTLNAPPHNQLPRASNNTNSRSAGITTAVITSSLSPISGNENPEHPASIFLAIAIPESSQYLGSKRDQESQSPNSDFSTHPVLEAYAMQVIEADDASSGNSSATHPISTSARGVEPSAPPETLKYGR